MRSGRGPARTSEAFASWRPRSRSESVLASSLFKKDMTGHRCRRRGLPDTNPPQREKRKAFIEQGCRHNTFGPIPSRPNTEKQASKFDAQGKVRGKGQRAHEERRWGRGSGGFKEKEASSGLIRQADGRIAFGLVPSHLARVALQSGTGPEALVLSPSRGAS